MAGITVETDQQSFTSQADMLGQELPRAGRLALESIANDVVERMRKRLAEEIDRPTAFTLQAPFAVTASGGRPEMLIGIKDQQASYLRYLFDGGTRQDALVPVDDADLDANGNMPRGYLRSMQAQGAFWMTSDSGVRALFLEEDGQLEAKAMVLDEVEYEKGLDFDEEASGIVSDLLPEAWDDALKQVFG